jgi:[ribosomal protein S5]-alanine N-acetyltransferase
MNLPPYDTFQTIASDKIVLRQIHTSDIKDLIEISFYDSIQAKTLQEAIEMQAKITKDYFEGHSIHWSIADPVTDMIVGTCGYYRGLDKGEGELGCVLLPQYREQGIMAPALQLAIDFGLHIIGLKRIWAITSKHNHKAIQLLDRLDFIKITDLQEDDIEYEYRTMG